MLQIVLEKPGQFAATEGAPPTLAPGEALVRVHRIGVCGTDLHAFAGRQPFFSYPRILGHELGVEVVDPGSDPHGLAAGDRCSVEPYINCGHCIACRRGKPNCCANLKVLGVHADGGMRPLFAVPARKLHRSAKLDYEQLALVETLGIGAHAVERAAIGRDDFVLVIGAGPIGLSVIQFALVSGATLAVMDVSEPRLGFCRDRIGVKHTVLAGAEAADRLKAIGGGDLPTVVIDATGNAKSMAGTFELAAAGGRIVFVGLFQGDVTFNDPNFHRRELTLCASRNALPETFREIIRLIEAGRVNTAPWITHRFTLAETPAVFPEKIAGNPAVLKAMIEV
ncbi:MAG TPA: zinc-binding alcohol dehydrogenase family protein [Candidatus Paceibacterota bacterium]|nr:zinc-binding alcohol dehydrogenase family protein [Candidatus Paceibacterota bacterium]